MEIQFSTLKQFEVQFPNGEKGTIEDAFIDERCWRIMRLVVRCGGWLFGARVGVNPSAFALYQNGSQVLKVDPDRAFLPVHLDDPDAQDLAASKSFGGERSDVPLHSMKEMQGFQIQVSRRWSGVIKDLIVDPVTWKIRKIVASQSVYLPGTRKEISLEDARKVTWFERGLLVQPFNHSPGNS